MTLLKFNRHWNQGFTYQFPKERKFLATLKQHTENKQIIELTGLRRTGKTTLFFQLINFLLQTGIEPHSIWYFSFDEQKYSLDELLAEFKKQTKKDINTDKLYIFLDEIQKLKDFQSQIKIYYDLYPNIKFFISGSTSLFIKKKIRESLAGRLFSFLLKPLDFHDYLNFRDKSNLLEFPEMYRAEISEEYEKYLSDQFVETISITNDELKKEYVIGILKKIIYEDIPQIFPVDNPEILYAIVKIIAQQPGMYLHYENLANDLKISSKTLSKYISILEQAFLIKILYNYSANQLTSEKKLKRVYLTSSSFCTALHDFKHLGLVVENAVLSIEPYSFFWRDAYKHEVDFIMIEGGKIIPIEVKYKNRIIKTDYNNLYLFAKKYKTNKAILLTNQTGMHTIEYKDVKIEVQSIFNSTHFQ
ncbi:hypothetical protein ES708_16819 [subsurface metagenome]